MVIFDQEAWPPHGAIVSMFRGEYSEKKVWFSDSGKINVNIEMIPLTKVNKWSFITKLNITHYDEVNLESCSFYCEHCEYTTEINL